MMARQIWPSFPISLPQGMVGAWPDCSAVLLPLQPLPYTYNTEIEDQRNTRKVLLHRSVFELVYSNVYLDLTDARLLGWYLSLSQEDRTIIQDEGGLHFFLKRHPFLEMSRQFIYVKSTLRMNQTGVTQTVHNSHRFKMPTSQECTCETHITNVATENLPHSMMENLTLVGGTNQSVYDWQNSSYAAHSTPVTPRADYQKAPQLSEPSWPMVDDSSISAAVSNDQRSLANLSLEMEPQRCKRQNPELTPMIQGQSTHITHSGISPLKSEETAVRKELSSGFCDCGIIHLDGSECNNKSLFETIKSEEETISSINEDPDSFHSIMCDDKSIVLLVAPNNQQPINSDEDASESGTPATSKTDQPSIQKTTAEKFISPIPCVPTCDVMVGTDLAICSSTFTQTQNAETADKHLITELHMSDLDHLAEVFIKLKSEREELQKRQMKCSGCKSIKKRDYVQRAQQAELTLLALQYRLYRQDCLKVCNTFSKKDQPLLVEKDIDHHSPESPPANIVNVLKKLESDYNEMREKIQAGIPLHDLKPLSADCEQINGAYVPSQGAGSMLGDSASGSSHEPQNNMSTEEPQCPHGENSKDCQNSQIYMDQLQEGISKMRGADIVIPNEGDMGHRPNESQSATPFKDVSASEAWYDAEEDLELVVTAETEQDTIMTSKHVIDEYGSGEKKTTSVLCDSDLSSDVSEKIIPLPLTSSLNDMKTVSFAPVAEGTCLPQCHCTSGSFDILMAELTQCHPDVGKQQILDALLELWVKHQGVLSGMTLRSIRQMTSDILTRPANTTQ